MSWSIALPQGDGGSLLYEEVGDAIDKAPNAPNLVEQMTNPDVVRTQVKACKSIAKTAALASGYKRMRVYLNGHTNSDGNGDNISVTIYNVIPSDID